MPQAPDPILRIWRQAELISNLSDRIVKIGPLNLGIDAALALIPVGGGVYTIGVGAWLLYMGVKAGASPLTLAKMAGYVGVDAATAGVPLVGAAVDILFPGHILACKALKRDIERRYGPIAPTGRRSWSDVADRFRGPAAA